MKRNDIPNLVSGSNSRMRLGSVNVSIGFARTAGAARAKPKLGTKTLLFLVSLLAPLLLLVVFSGGAGSLGGGEFADSLHALFVS